MDLQNIRSYSYQFFNLHETFKLQNGVRYTVEYNSGSYVLHIEKPQLTIKTHIINGTIKNNLFTDAVVGGVNATTLYNVLNEYAFLIDFQRDIHPNDKFVLHFDDKKLDIVPIPQYKSNAVSSPFKSAISIAV